MKKVSPTVIHKCVQQLWLEPKEFLALLLIAKKLYVRHGMQLTKREYIETIATKNQQLAIVLSLLQELQCKKAEDITLLIRNMSRHEDYFICSVDASRPVDTDSIDHLIEKHVHEKNIYTSSTLHVPWLHITSDSHRYGRTLDDDMDRMLGAATTSL